MEDTFFTQTELEIVRDRILRPFVSSVLMSIFFAETEGKEGFEKKVLENLEMQLKKSIGKYDIDSKIRDSSVAFLKENVGLLVVHLIENGRHKIEDIVVQIEIYTDEQTQKIHEVLVKYDNNRTKN
jgi:hypothetical protein